MKYLIIVCAILFMVGCAIRENIEAVMTATRKEYPKWYVLDDYSSIAMDTLGNIWNIKHNSANVGKVYRTIFLFSTKGE